MKRIKILNKYYTNLDYDKSDKKKTLTAIYNLSQTVKFNADIDIYVRLLQMEKMIRDNFSLFASVFKHIDIFYTIVDYVIIYTAEYNTIETRIAKMGDKGNLFHNLMITLFTVCRDLEMQLFFSNYLLSYEPHVIFKHCEAYALYIQYQESEMIILKDSDLYAVVNYLIITSDHRLHKIWVQEQVKEKFLWLIERYHFSTSNISIDTFYSLKDIQLNVSRRRVMKILSIWSEDIVLAKNLALSLNGHVVFLNSYMDFRDGIVSLCYMDLFDYIMFQSNIISISLNKFPDVEESVNEIRLSRNDEKNSTLICKLFYDGTWQKPKKRLYWKHNDNLWPNATNYDILQCYESAEKGFNTWSIKPIKTRTEILSKFVSILKDNGKLGLAAIVERCLNFRYLCNESILGFSNSTAEVIHTRKPLGIIILREKNENIFFFRLIQTLISGNSVIVIFDRNFYNLAPYCDVFLTCGVPPGVINLLSHEDSNMLETRLCSPYTIDYVSRYFLKGNSIETYISQYKKLTLPKEIILYVA